MERAHLVLEDLLEGSSDEFADQIRGHLQLRQNFACRATHDLLELLGEFPADGQPAVGDVTAGEYQARAFLEDEDAAEE